jgi:hypothetical protein
LWPGVLAIPDSAIIVYDPINEVHHVKNLAESIKIMQQAVTTYNRITDQYNHMKYMAQYLKNMPGRYKAPLTPWKGMSATSTYGTTNRWIAAVNQGIDSMQGWESATLPSVDFAGAFGNIPASQQPRRKAEFATLELQDGAGVSALETIGRIRGNGPQVETTLASIEADSLASAADMQTEAAQMNKANAIAVIQAKAIADQNKLLVTNTELALLRLKQERDATAYAQANEVAFRKDAHAVMSAQHADITTAILGYRLP